MGPMMSSLPVNVAPPSSCFCPWSTPGRHIMLSEGAVNLSRYAWFVRWACNGFTGSTVPATGLRAPGPQFGTLAFIILLHVFYAAIGLASAHG